MSGDFGRREEGRWDLLSVPLISGAGDDVDGSFGASFCIEESCTISFRVDDVEENPRRQI